jgi:putative heme degradation protein
MAIDSTEAQEIIESVFDFDHVGDAMFAVRKNLDAKEAQESLIQELIRCGTEELSEDSPENREALTAAAKARVEQFVKGSKFSQSGCSGL